MAGRFRRGSAFHPVERAAPQQGRRSSSAAQAPAVEDAPALQGLRAASLSVTSRGLDAMPADTHGGGEALGTADRKRQSVGRVAFGQGSSLRAEPPREAAGLQPTQRQQPEIAFSNRKAQLLHRWVGENAAAEAAAAAAAAAGTSTPATDAQQTQDSTAAHHN